MSASATASISYTAHPLLFTSWSRARSAIPTYSRSPKRSSQAGSDFARDPPLVEKLGADRRGAHDFCEHALVAEDECGGRIPTISLVSAADFPAPDQPQRAGFSGGDAGTRFPDGGIEAVDRAADDPLLADVEVCEDEAVVDDPDEQGAEESSRRCRCRRKSWYRRA